MHANKKNLENNYGANHIKIDPIWIDLRSLQVRFENVFTLV